MQTEKIYHYTNVDSLALILSNKTLRFTRLDRVDDIQESQTHEGIEFGKYFFVSCWTQQEEDNIAQWKMYGGDMGGVRIEFPINPFRRIKLISRPYMHFEEGCYSPFSSEELVRENCMILPTMDNSFAGAVQYVDDVKQRYISAIRRSEDNGVGKVTIDGFDELARLKSKVWEFQSEYRFVLKVLPLKPSFAYRVPGTLAQDQVDSLGAGMMNNLEPGITFIDVPIDLNTLEHMVITMGPLCTPGSEVCVQALLAAHAPKAQIRKSSLTGALRRK